MKSPKISRLMAKDIISVVPDTMLNQAVEIMRKNKISFLIVVKNRKPIGVLSERDIVRLACEQSDPKLLQVKDVMTSPVVSVTKNADIFTVYDLLHKHKIRHMVVVDDDGLIAGLATLTNILGGLSIEYFIELKQVSNIMSSNISTLNTDDSMQQALTLMTEKRISCVIITHQDKPVGIITERDITRLYAHTLDKHARVESIMSQPVRTIGVNTFIPQANALMKEERLRHLVIVHADGRLAGIISQSDIARRIEEHYVNYLRTMVKRQGKKLQYEHARFSVLFEQNPNAIISMDVEGMIVDVNQAYCLLSGYSQQEMIGRRFDSFIHSEDVTSAQHSFNKTHEDNTEHVEFRILQKYGEAIPVFNNYLSISADSNLHRIYSIMHDISNRQSDEQRFHMAEEKAKLLSQAIEQTKDSVIITDKQGTIEFVNEAFTRITGYTSKEATGNRPSILKSGEQDKAFYEQMWGSITQGKTWQSRLVDRRKNGEFYPAELSISPMYNSSGEITHFIGIKRDLTEREELEKQFRQAQKMEALGNLVGGIAHDFNNMLAGMTGNLYLAKRKIQNNPDVVDKLAKVEELAMRSADMIQQLLTFARKGSVNMKEIPFIQFIKETIKFLQSSIPENISLKQNICTGSMTITGDTTQLHQILMNLINNARDAVEKSINPSITITLEIFQPDDVFLATHSYFKEDSYAHLSVGDNGCGIPEDQIKHLFEPFFTTKPEGKGTGLGLAMVFGAVKTHHGFIEVQSEAKGSSFHIYLPLTKVKNSIKEPKYENTIEGSGELILLADDEQNVRETTAEVLETQGYKVLQAGDGREAVSLFEKHQHMIAIVILDVVMPHMSGVDVALQIKKIKPDLPLIFMTGYDKEQIPTTEQSISKYTIVSKPVNFDTLSSEIHKMLT